MTHLLSDVADFIDASPMCVLLRPYDAATRAYKYTLDRTEKAPMSLDRQIMVASRCQAASAAVAALGERLRTVDKDERRAYCNYYVETFLMRNGRV